MENNAVLSPQLVEILHKLIDNNIWATRERLGAKRAIHMFDQESQYLHPQPYSTNLDIRFDTLANLDSDLLDQIANYIAVEVLAGRRDLKLVGTTAFRAKKYTTAVLARISSLLGFEIVEQDQLLDQDHLVLLVGAHSQEMVEFWRAHDDRITAVVTLLGTTRRHIERDLHLPAAKYHALASWDALDKIAPQHRKVMIPGAHDDEDDHAEEHRPTAPPSSQLVAPMQPMASVEEQLLELKQWVEKITYPGEFLLSVNKFSDSWLYIVEFNRREVRQLASQILQHILSCYLSEQTQPYVLFCSEFGSLSEDEFATADVANKAFRSLNYANLNFERYWKPKDGDIKLNDAEFKGKQSIGFFVLSIHVDFLLDIIDKIRSIGGQVAALVTIIERDNVGRGAFAARGVDLIPFIVWEAEKKELKTVLERTEATYTPYHQFFK